MQIILLPRTVSMIGVMVIRVPFPDWDIVPHFLRRRRLVERSDGLLLDDNAGELFCKVNKKEDLNLMQGLQLTRSAMMQGHRMLRNVSPAATDSASHYGCDRESGQLTFMPRARLLQSHRVLGLFYVVHTGISGLTTT